MLAIFGSNASLGKQWTTYFLRRNPSLKAMKGTHIEKSRAEAVAPEKIKKMYAVFDEPLVKAIRPQNRWNVDETGIMDDITFPGLFIGPSDNKRPTAIDHRVYFRRGQCSSAHGHFEGKNIQQQWFPNDQRAQAKLQSWRFTYTDNGYSSNFVSLEWLHKVFIPLTDPGGQDWRLLVLDGHESHVSDDFLSECQAYRIWIAVLPPHSSHITQPLDVSAFSSLKIRCRQFRDDVALVSNVDTLSKEDFLMCYYRARMQSFTAQSIRPGWRQSGLWPLDVSIPLDSPRLFQPLSEMIEEIAQEIPT